MENGSLSPFFPPPVDESKIDIFSPAVIMAFVAAFIGDLTFFLIIPHYLCGVIVLGAFSPKTKGILSKLVLGISFILPGPFLTFGIVVSLILSNKILAFIAEQAAVVAATVFLTPAGGAAVEASATAAEAGAVAAEAGMATAEVAEGAAAAAEGVEAAATAAETAGTTIEMAQNAGEAWEMAETGTEGAEAGVGAAEGLGGAEEGISPEKLGERPEIMPELQENLLEKPAELPGGQNIEEKLPEGQPAEKESVKKIRDIYEKAQKTKEQLEKLPRPQRETEEDNEEDQEDLKEAA